jgi:WD40 repeat protein
MTGGMDFGTVFYAGPPFKMDHSNNVHTNFVNCVRYSPDGSKIVSVGSDRKIQLYDGTTGQPASEVADAHAGSIYSVCFSPDNSKFVTASGDKTLKIWNAQSLACELTLEPAPDSSVAEMQLSVLWTDLYIISLSLNGNINLFRPDNPQPVKSIEGHQVSISSLCYDPVSNSIYTGSLDGVVCVSNPDTAETMKLIPQDKKTISKNSHGGKVSGIICSGEEVISIGWDDSIRFANPTTREYIESIATNGQPIAISGSNIPGVYAVITNAELSLYNGRNVVASLTKLPYSGTCISLYGDSEVAVGGDDSKTHLYSVANGTFTEITTIPTRSPVSSVAYSPTGDFIAIGDNGRQVEVYERGTWAVKVQGIWVFHTSKITALAWSPSGSHLASGSLDESIFVWDMSTPKKKIQYQFAHMSGVSGLSWLSSNKLVSCGNDQTVVTWNVAIE